MNPAPCLTAARILLALLSTLTMGQLSWGADCTQTSTGLVPLSQIAATDRYLGLFEGGLYPGGNSIPVAHFLQGLNQAAQIRPRLPGGSPAATGRIVLMSIGMSNTTQEWCNAASVTNPCAPPSFTAQAAPLDSINWGELTIVDGAKSGQTAATWDSPTDPNYDRIRDQVLTPQGLGEGQVQAIWLKVANAGPTVHLPAPNADAYLLKSQIGKIARALRVRYPNLRLVFISSRIYAGYATTTLNPEPYAYESAFGTKWAIGAQVAQLAGSAADPQAGDLSLNIAPHLSWGPYLWADGLTPRADGLVWACGDLASDGTHPSTLGQEKVGRMLLDFFGSSQLCADWFRAAGPPLGDLDNDGVVSGQDLTYVLTAWGTSLPLADLDRSGLVDGGDLTAVLVGWGDGGG